MIKGTETAEVWYLMREHVPEKFTTVQLENVIENNTKIFLVENKCFYQIKNVNNRRVQEIL